MTRALLLCLVLAGSACAPSAPTAADLAPLAEALDGEDYADAFLDELETRLDAADLDLSREQHRALRPILMEGAEAQRALIRASADDPPAVFQAQSRVISERTDAAALAVLSAAQAPTFVQLRAEARALLLSQIGR